MQQRLIAAGLTIAMLLTCITAFAQPAPTTLLHLSASRSVQVSPDQLIADLVAQSTSLSAAEAQRHVNTLMADGMKLAQDVAGLQVRAINYSVNPAGDKQTTWTAQQTLELRATDGPVLLDLVNRLQAKGFAAASLGWQLSPELRQQAHNEATTAALKALQMQAAAAAETLGLHIDHVQDVNLGGPAFQPRMALPMRAMATQAGPAPQATATPEEVTADVSADVVLRP